MRSHAMDVTPTVTSGSAYASGNQLGGLMTLTSPMAGDGGAGMINKITIVEQGSAQNSALDLFFFDSQPTIASTDKTNVDITSANAAKCIGHVAIAASDYKTLKASTNSVACVRNVWFPVKCASRTNTLYVLAVCRGTPTYASTTALTFRFQVDWET